VEHRAGAQGIIGTQAALAAPADGTTLLYDGVLAVRADTPTNLTVLSNSSSPPGFVYDHPWVPVQMWGRQPE